MTVIRQGYATLSAFPPTGLVNIIYVDLSNGNEYVWNGTTYIVFVPTKVIMEEGVKSASWFTANASVLLGKGQRVNLDTQQGLYKLGDGVTALSALSFLGTPYTLTTAEIGGVINGAISATPNDTDLVMSVDTSVAKKNTWAQIKAFLKTYFDTVYTTTSAVASQIATALSGYLTSATAASTYQTILGYTAENIANKSSSYTASSTTTYANTKALVDGLATKGVLSYLDQLVVSGNYMPAKNGYGTTAGTAGLNAYLSGQRISNRKTCIVTSLSVYCNTGVAGGNVRISIWSDLNGLPNSLLVDSGDIVCTSSGRKEAVITPFTLTENVVYHVGVQVSSATINLAYYSVSEKTYYSSATSNYVLYLLASYAYGAPPATFPAITFYYDTVGFAPYVLLKQQ